MEDKMIFLYHRVMRRENFETAASDLYYLILNANKKYPGQKRALYLDIDDHRNSKGGFDSDMLELQKDFCLGFLFPFLTEVHVPLISIKNPNSQSNNIPDELQILNERREKDDSLDKLYIENYSNTEFVSEKVVYDFMEKISNFLKDYQRNHDFNLLENPDKFYQNKWFLSWKRHTTDLIIELFNAFLYGNLVSACAMTRSLIECYVYLKIIIKEKNEKLLEEWFICSTIKSIRKYEAKYQELAIKNLKDYCQQKEIDFKLKWDLYHNKKENENSWLKLVIPKKHITFKTACQYLGNEEIYEDFKSTSSFVHGQDMTTKMLPFAFYESIYDKFYVMMTYIFKTIRLFSFNKDTKNQIQELEHELLKVGESIFNITHQEN